MIAAAAFLVRKWVPIGAWNPAVAPQATYRIDGNDTVAMTWTPTTGESRDYSGDVQAQIDPGHPDHRKRVVVLRVIAIVYAVAAIGGFAGGYAVSSGTPGRRGGFGLAGICVALIVLWIVVTQFRL